MRLAAALGNETSALESQVTGGRRRAAAVRRPHGRTGPHVATPCSENWTNCARRRDASDPAGGRADAMAGRRPRISWPSCQQQHAARQKELSEMRQRHSGAAERAAVLEELVRRHEGLSAGVKEVLAAGRRSGRPRVSRRSRAGGRPVPRQRRSRRRWWKSPWARRPSTSLPIASDDLIELLADRIQPAWRPGGLRLARRKRCQEPFLRNLGVPLFRRTVPDTFSGPDRPVRACSGGPTASWKRQPRVRPAGQAAAGANVVRREARPRRRVGRRSPAAG